MFNSKILPLIIFSIVLAGCASQETTVIRYPQVAPATPEMKTPGKLDSSFNRAPLSQCIECLDGKVIESYTCCEKDFESQCQAKNGVTRWNDLHPFYATILRSCYTKAPDAGKACASANDCLSGVCDLADAVKANRCTFAKKSLLPTSNGQPGSDEKFFEADYTCTTNTPGICQEAVNNGVNPGGIDHQYFMRENLLIEIQQPGPIM